MSQRGYCQDLDEGKLSFPFIHTHQKLGNNDTILTNLLHMRDRRNGLSREAKEYILKQIEESGSLDYTQDLLDQLLSDIQCTLGNMETVTGKRNWVLQSMMSQLRIGREKSAVKESTFANVLRVWGAYGAAAWRTKLN
jgi:geranylgeranyl pyrophosphate synthase